MVSFAVSGVSVYGDHITVRIGSASGLHEIAVHETGSGTPLGAYTVTPSVPATTAVVPLSPVPNSTSLTITITALGSTPGALDTITFYLPRDTTVPTNIASNVCTGGGYNTQIKENEIAGVGNHYSALFWEYDPRVARRWNVDPIRKDNVSPFSTFANNSILNNDVLGNTESTHTDNEGNVVDVKNDGDLGVYKHSGNKEQTKKEIAAKYSATNTGAGGTYMGESVTPLGFADFFQYENSGKVLPARGACIDFESNWATEKAGTIFSSHPSLLEYADKARGGHEWDLKSHAPGDDPYFGSNFYGKIASARDVGNMVAGGVAQQSPVPNFISDFGFGLYNMSGNSVGKSVIGLIGVGILFNANPQFGIYAIMYVGDHGEDKLSKQGIEAGKKIMREQGGGVTDGKF